jgi:GntR family transcriptional regulator
VHETEREGRSRARAAGSSPRWRQIADQLDREIREGEHVARFPGEIELAERFHVSRGTIRAALRPLREAGVVSAARGRRPEVVVRDRASTFGPVYSLAEAVQTAGLEASSRVLRQEMVTSSSVAAALLVPPRTPLFHLVRVRLARSEPIATDETWILGDLSGPLVSADFTAAPVYELLRDRCGVVLDGGREEVWSVGASTADAALLGCRRGAPLLRARRLSHQGGRWIELRETRALGSSYSVVRTFGEAEPCPASTTGTDPRAPLRRDVP